MIADAIENLVGDWAKVTSLMGPGVDPHLYKATQGDLTKLQKADLIFYNGMYLEGKMEDVLERLAKKKPVKAITDNIPASRRLPLEEDGHTVTDPHVWFDVKLWESGVSTIVKKLVTLYPKHEGEIEDNAKAYIQKLDALHEQVKSEIANIPVNQRILITSHDAFGYFERAYNIEVKALQGLSTVTEFGLKDLTNLVNLITEKKIPAIFVESSVASKPMEAIVKGCKEKGHDVKIGGVLYSDAMGEYGTKEGTYLGMVEHNLRTITQALK
ncbi:UNVERIFIED_CONTAM: hypothetical protein GTU68_043712 [Idotea baltica]|nr:hypothetical protein [Idotea baltica]